MRKELADSLRHMQSHPTTGTPHNQQLISTQVESIFMLDELNENIKKLNTTIEIFALQSQKLEKSNYRLQKVMLIFTAVTTTIIAFPILLALFNLIGPFLARLLNIAIFPIAVGVIVSAVVSLLTGYTTFKIQLNLTDKIKLKDNIDIVVKDKKGRIKEVRHVE